MLKFKSVKVQSSKFRQCQSSKFKSSKFKVAKFKVYESVKVFESLTSSKFQSVQKTHVTSTLCLSSELKRMSFVI